jgi:iron complex outermembrane receptor protein
MISTTFVGKQYFTNNEIEALSLEAYNFTNLDLSYTISSQKVRSVRFGVTLYNLFNQLYCSNGYGYSYMWDGVRYDEAYYFPQAPLHALANISINF